MTNIRIGGIWLLFAFALLIRLGVLAVNARSEAPHYMVPDSWTYTRAAVSLQSQGAFADEEGRPVWTRVPAYPLLLTASFITRIASPSSLGGILFLQAILGALLVLMSSKIASRLAGPVAGVIAGIFVAIEPSSIAYTNLVLSECLYTFILLTLILTWWQWRRRSSTVYLIILAVLTGILPLVRPVALYLPAVMALFILLTMPSGRPRIVPAILFLVIALVPTITWSARNGYLLGAARLGERGPLIKALFARAVEKAAGVPVAQTERPHPWDRNFLAESGLPSADAFRLQEKYFSKVLMAHPMASLRVPFVNGLALIGVPDDRLHRMLLESTPSFEGGSVRARLAWLGRLGPFALWLLFGMTISVAGVVLLPIIALSRYPFERDRRDLLFLLLLLTYYHLGLSAFVLYQAERYRVPVMPLLAIGVSVAVAIFWTRMLHRGVPDDSSAVSHLS